MDRLREIRFADVHLRPDPPHQLVFGNHLSVVLNEDAQRVKQAGSDGEAASIARQQARYDSIQISLIDTWAATAAGAFVLSENSIYTVEAWTVFLEHLSDEGLLSVSRWYFRDRPGEMYRITTLAVEALDADCWGNEAVWAGDRVVGITTSGGYAYWLGQSLAVAYVDAALATPGTPLTVEVLGERRPAVVLAEPPFDPENCRPRS